MIEIPFWAFIAKVQLIIVLSLIALFYFFRARSFKKRFSRNLEQAKAESASVEAEHPQEGLPNQDLKALGELQEKLALAQQRVDNLERFRDMFFELKSQMDGLLEQQEKMGNQIACMSPAEQNELAAEFEKLKKQKETLEQHLQQVEAELDVLTSPSHGPAVGDREGGNAESIIQEQQAEIGRLIQDIADLEVEAAAAQRIQSSISNMNTNMDELAIAVEVLQDENEFLSKQIQSLLKQEQENDAQTSHQIDSLTRELAEKSQSYDELYAKHTRLESEYLRNKT